MKYLHSGPLKIVTISGGVSSPSSSDMVASVILETLTSKTKEVEMTITNEHVFIREHAVSVALATVNGVVDPQLEKALRLVTESDIIVAVSPVFKGSMAGIFKAFFDLLPENSLKNKSVIIAATGRSTRHSLVPDIYMRPLFAFLKASTITSSVFFNSTPELYTQEVKILKKRILEIMESEIPSLRPSQNFSALNI